MNNIILYLFFLDSMACHAVIEPAKNLANKHLLLIYRIA